MPRQLSEKKQKWYYLTHSWEDKGFHTFPKGICPKVNVIARLEYELAYYDFAVHHFNYYTTRTPPLGFELVSISYDDNHETIGTSWMNKDL